MSFYNEMLKTPLQHSQVRQNQRIERGRNAPLASQAMPFRTTLSKMHVISVGTENYKATAITLQSASLIT